MKNSDIPCPLKLQLANADQLDQAANIIRETAQWLKTKGIKQWSENFPLSRLQAEVSDGELFVILDNSQKIIGTISLSHAKSEIWPDDKQTAIHLNRLAISREYSGRNLGSKIISWAKEYAQQKGATVLRLCCDKTNPFLPNFYQSCGFDCIGESFYSPWQMTFLLFEMRI